MNESTKILITDDHPSYLEGVSSILHSIMPKATILTALNGADTLTLLQKHPDTDWVLLDVNLPDCSGIELLDQFKTLKVIANIIIITSDNSPDLINQALNHHVNGFLTKDFNHQILSDCFKSIENDQLFLTDEHALQLKNYRESNLLEKQQIEEHLSKRLQQTLMMIEKGYSNHEIANSLGISESTVKKHVSSVMALFEADNRTHCVAEARRLKLLN